MKIDILEGTCDFSLRSSRMLQNSGSCVALHLYESRAHEENDLLTRFVASDFFSFCGIVVTLLREVHLRNFLKR